MQVVGYEPGVDGPAELRLSDGDGSEVRAEPLAAGRKLAYTLGPRRCAGEIREGRHVGCDAEAAPRCPDHRSTWVCARCTGECLKEEMDCHQPHAVYLAAFAPATFKVGVTRLARLETRLREQGADRGAHVRTVADGRAARRIEAGIAERIPDRVGVDTKRDGLARAVDEEAWRALLDGFDVSEEFALDYGLDLDARPVPETVATGRVRGTKGRLLVLDRGEATSVVDARDLVGHELEPGATDRDRQARLGAFG